MKDSLPLLLISGLVLVAVVFLRTRGTTSIRYGDVTTLEIIGGEFGAAGSPDWHSLVPSSTAAAAADAGPNYTGGSTSTTTGRLNLPQ